MPFSRLIKSIKQQINQLKQKKVLNPFDITIFLRQFATLIAAGIPMIQSCDILEKSQEKIALRLLIYAIKRDILTGKTLFNSLRHHSMYFDELTCQLIRIGEHTGKLDTMLITIANSQEKKLAFLKRIKQTLFYPCIIAIIAFIVTFGMFVFVIPKFAELFHDIQEKLPTLTIWMFYFSTGLEQHLWLCLLGFCVVIIMGFYSQSSPTMKHYLYSLLSALPFIKTAMHKIILAKFSRNIAMTLGAGIPITDALKLTADACGNTEFAGIIAKLRTKISTGLQLHHAMAALPYFPVLMTQMVKIGEESGTLEYMLEKIAHFFEADIDQFVSHLSQLLEPLLMIVLGVLIGGLVIGMYLPLFKLGYIN